VKRLTLLGLCLPAAWMAPMLVSHGRADSAAPSRARAGSQPSALASPSTRGTVSVDLVNVDSSHGQLLAALFRTERHFPDGGDKAFGKVVQKARAGSMRLRFEDVPAGPYAVTVHHDEDGDFAFDTGLFGIPTEGYGFSRNAHAPFGPPDFEDCVLVMKPGQHQRLRIRIRY
jgi:uncharacterized protein (DUF2141 family)